MDIKGGWCDSNISNDCIYTFTTPPPRSFRLVPLPALLAVVLAVRQPAYSLSIYCYWIGYDYVFIMSLTYHDYGTFQGHQCAAFAFEALLLLALVWAPSPEISHVH